MLSYLVNLVLKEIFQMRERHDGDANIEVRNKEGERVTIRDSTWYLYQ